MKQFEIGKTYTMGSWGDGEDYIIWSYTVIARTAKTLRVRDKWGEEKTLRVLARESGFWNAETVAPLGKYSMCPMLRATDYMG